MNEGKMELKKRVQRVLTRRKFIYSAVGTVVAGATGYGFGVEPNLVKVCEVELEIPMLPKSFDGLRAIQLTDIHFQKNSDHKLMEKVVEVVNSIDAKIILHTGDYVAEDTDSLPQLAEYLREISNGRENFAILGNHDVWHESENYYRRFFDAIGIELLVNESATLKRNGETLPIVGVDSVWGNPNVKKSFIGVHQKQAAITLMHEPDYFDEIIKEREVLCQLSGHTHGGQCRIPIINYAPVSVKYGKKYQYGYFSKGESRQLFVSSGLGTTGLRVRFSCQPEVVVHTLRAK